MSDQPNPIRGNAAEQLLRAYLRTIDRSDIDHLGIRRAVELAGNHQTDHAAAVITGTLAGLPAGNAERPGLTTALALLSRDATVTVCGRAVIVATNDGPDKVTVRVGTLHPSDKHLRVVVYTAGHTTITVA